MPLPANVVGHLLPILDRLAQILNERQIKYALIGGLGVAVRGEIRATGDIDLLVKIPQMELPKIFDALIANGFQLDLKQAIETWNRDHLLDFSCGSVRVDWLKPVLPAFERILDRAPWEQIGERRIRVADAEGLVLLKLIAFRARDQEDIKGILAANHGRLELDWVRREWDQLGGDTDPRTQQFEQLVRDFYDAPASSATQ